MGFKQYLKEVYSKENFYLKKYMNDKDFPFSNYIYLKDEWLNDKDLSEEDIFGETILDDDYDLFEDKMSKLSKRLQDSFKDFVIDWLHKNEPTEVPSWAAMNSDKKLIHRLTWLNHFSDNADDIWLDGFKFGHDQMDTLSLTTSKNNRKQTNGYNFAVVAGSRDGVSITHDGKYGDDFVMFQNSGVKAYHYGDEENQVIFWGKDVKLEDIVYVKKVDGDYAVIGNSNWKENKEYVFTGDYKTVVKWIETNWQQYKRVLKGG